VATAALAVTRALAVLVELAGPETAGLLTRAALAEEQAVKAATVPTAQTVATARLLAQREPTAETAETQAMVD
jgi:hypothetical protein